MSVPLPPKDFQDCGVRILQQVINMPKHAFLAPKMAFHAFFNTFLCGPDVSIMP